jgi:hypothetical protein
MMMMDVIGSSNTHKKQEEETKIPDYSPTD